MKKIICYVMILALATCMLTACGGTDANVIPGNVVCVIGGVNNNPVVDVSIVDELTGLAARPGSTYTVINAEGTPREICSGEIEDLSEEGYTDKMMERIYASKVAGMKNAVDEAAPITPEVDIAAATVLAVRSLRINQADDRDNILVYYLSGISTRGLINMVTTPVYKMDVEASVPTIIEELGLDMTGIDVVFYCCGDTAGADQPALSPGEKDTLKEFYDQLFLAMGADSVTFMDDLPGNGCYDFDQEVSVMKTAEIGNGLTDLDEGKVIEFSDKDVAFLPDSTELADQDAATEALSNVIEYMKQNEDFELLICGTTTSAGEKDSCREFSEERAAAIRGLLIQAGIDEDRIQILGCGWSSSLYCNDRNADGTLNEDIAPDNRSVKMLDANCDKAAEIHDSLKNA